jgi:NADH-quinone oxidoreductase subunit J
MLGIELALFIIVGAIAILAAVLMLVSENAVHSALFLIVNFACVAFFYLMLNASFLAMVQITVYAGAIMVLFLFVIMLLGAEKLTPESSPQFPWLTPMAIGLTTIFLLVAGIAIIEGELGTGEPEPRDPLLRVVHAVGSAPAVDVYLDGELLAENLAFRGHSDYETMSKGEHNALVVLHGEDPTSTEPVLAAPIFLNADDVVTWVVLPDTTGGTVQALAVKGSLDALDDPNIAELTVVHTLPCSEASCAVDIADISTPSDTPIMLIKGLKFGEVSAVKTIREGNYTLGVFPAGAIAEALAASENGKIDVEPLLALREADFADNQSNLWVVSADTRDGGLRPVSAFISTPNEDVFGSGQSLGRRLFTTYMLPFQAIAVLLLVAMVGVIVLTNPLDTSKPPRRPRRERRMAAIPGNPTVDEYQKTLDKTSSAGD